MSVPALKRWFEFKGRRNRKSFFQASLAFFGIALVISAIGAVAGLEHDLHFHAILLPVTVIYTVVLAQRLRDFDVPGWVAIPVTVIGDVAGYFEPATGIFYLIFFFMPGAKGSNKYGPDPLASDTPEPVEEAVK